MCVCVCVWACVCRYIPERSKGGDGAPGRGGKRAREEKGGRDDSVRTIIFATKATSADHNPKSIARGLLTLSIILGYTRGINIGALNRLYFRLVAARCLEITIPRGIYPGTRAHHLSVIRADLHWRFPQNQIIRREAREKVARKGIQYDADNTRKPAGAATSLRRY